MFKRITSFAGILALAVAAFTGCADSTLTSPEGSNTLTSKGSADFSILVVDEVALADYTAVPALGELLSSDAPTLLGDPGDPTRGRDVPPRDDQGRRPPVKMDNLERILRQLQLTPEQAAAIRICAQQNRECASSAQSRYDAARRAIAEELRTRLMELRQQVADGSVTPEQARAMHARIMAAHRSAMEPLNHAIRTAVEACRAAFEECVKSNLTREQIVRWDRLTKKPVRG